MEGTTSWHSDELYLLDEEAQELMRAFRAVISDVEDDEDSGQLGTYSDAGSDEGNEH